jgi:hypothetical protein
LPKIITWLPSSLDLTLFSTMICLSCPCLCLYAVYCPSIYVLI